MATLKIVDADKLDSDLTSVADAIREKNGTTDAIEFPDGFRMAIENFGGIEIMETTVKSVAHRGYSAVAPENTIPAYILAKRKGFKYAECDVAFTKDGVAVLLHDDTIDRTSDGSGSISSMTYADVWQYDFGSWKSAEYAGTKIATFEEFIKVCKFIGLHPYIEIKDGNYTQAQVESIVDMVESVGMKGEVTYISFNSTFLGYIKAYDTSATLGYVTFDITSSVVNTASALKTDTNDVFVTARNDYVTNDKIALLQEKDLPLQVWCLDDASAIESIPSYVSGVTSNILKASDVLYDKYMTYTAPSDPNESGELVYVITNDDLSYGFGYSEVYPWKTERTNRAGCYDYNLPLTGGATYRVVIDSSAEAQVGLHFYNQIALATSDNGAGSVIVKEKEVYDGGWLNSGDTVTVPVSYHGAPIAGVNLTCHLVSDGAMTDGTIRSIRLYKVAETERDTKYVRVLTSEEIRYGAMPYGLRSGYYEVNAIRSCYCGFDIPIEGGSTYKFELESAVSTAQIGLQFFTQYMLDFVNKDESFNNTLAYDYGSWCNSGIVVTVPETHNGSPIIGIRFSFRMDTNNSTCADGFIQKVYITKVE